MKARDVGFVLEELGNARELIRNLINNKRLEDDKEFRIELEEIKDEIDDIMEGLNIDIKPKEAP